LHITPREVLACPGTAQPPVFLKESHQPLFLSFFFFFFLFLFSLKKQKTKDQTELDCDALDLYHMDTAYIHPTGLDPTPPVSLNPQQLRTTHHLPLSKTHNLIQLVGIFFCLHLNKAECHKERT
jgi:hypothetical protein